ncbi:MAG: response regulator transcription factor [Bacillota bacterium]|nr:response regulator transcription factor [Bacillota bacterium]
MICCVEDDSGIRELVVYTLKNTGFNAMGFESGDELFKAMLKEKPELILLDIMLPGTDGIQILKRLRSNAVTKKIPVIMLTAKGTEYDKIIGLDSGADDYVTKPFGMMELISRIKAVLRRFEENSADDEYSFGSVKVNAKAHSVYVDNVPVDLTLKEFELLHLLMKNAGIVLTRDMLLENIWGYDFDGETRTVDVHIRTLRTKLGSGGDIIETVRGVGYRIGGVR